MASKSSRLEHMQQRTARLHLTGLQKSILHRLYSDRRQPQDGETHGVPYTKLVGTVTADKARVTTTLRQLMRQGLVAITLPRGAWTRCVALTEQGRAYARSLLQQERRPSGQVYADEAARFMVDDNRGRASARRRGREYDDRKKRHERRIRHRSHREHW
jgi:DNA-binding PadR family transcriptional regulator